MDNNARIYAEINLDAVCENARRIKQKVGDRRLMAIIKADAYGHGSVAVASALREEGLADAFGIATLTEAVVLRRRGITEQILVLGYTFPQQYDVLIQNNITQTIFQYESAKLLSDAAVKAGRTATVHIKLDTGMGRIGFRPCMESVEEVAKIFSLPNLFVEGIFSHFACADMKNDSSVSAQKKLFDDFVAELEKRGINIPVKHIANSAGVIEYDDCYYDMVRSGIILYGLYPSQVVSREKLELIPALTLKSHVSYVKTINPGDKVSYGSVFTATKPTVVATVPIGYADGYPRTNSEKNRVLIRGRFAPIIGRVCMDQFMVDATDIPNIRQGDRVTVVGRDGRNQVTVDEISENAGLINYEFVCGLSRRVPRVYKRNGSVVLELDYLEYEC